MAVKIRLRDGHELLAAGYANNIQQAVNEARGKGELISIEKDAIPTGQFFYVDPNEVMLVRDDRW